MGAGFRAQGLTLGVLTATEVTPFTEQKKGDTREGGWGLARSNSGDKTPSLGLWGSQRSPRGSVLGMCARGSAFQILGLAPVVRALNPDGNCKSPRKGQTQKLSCPSTG